MTRTTSLVLVSAALMATSTTSGCGECSLSEVCEMSFLQAIDLDDWERARVDYAEIGPEPGFDHWQMWDRRTRGLELVASGGERTLDELTPSERALLDPSDQPVSITPQFTALDGGEVRVWKTFGEQRAFLGAIETPSEAVLFARASLYSMHSVVKSRGAVREVPGGFQVIAERVTQLCPLRRHRYLLAIAREGTLRVGAEELTELSDACWVTE